jgi:hypothetical protein
MLHRMAKYRAIPRCGINWLYEGLEHRVVIARTSQTSRKEKERRGLETIIEWAE